MLFREVNGPNNTRYFASTAMSYDCNFNGPQNFVRRSRSEILFPPTFYRADVVVFRAQLSFRESQRSAPRSAVQVDRKCFKSSARTTSPGRRQLNFFAVPRQGKLEICVPATAAGVCEILSIKISLLRLSPRAPAWHRNAR